MKKVSLILNAVAMTAMMLSSCGDDASKEGTSGASKEGTSGASKEGTSGASKEGSSDVSKEGSSDASKEVTIGSQVWMTKNLDVSTFRNGDPIPHAKTVEEWKKAGKNGQPAWCYYDNDPANGEKYGKLYNWYAVNDPRGLAPKGWHVPSDEEWTQLTDYLGGEQAAGTKMKYTDFWAGNDWESGNGTNESEFSGLPGGFRNGNTGIFGYIGEYGYWWSSTEYNPNFAWCRGLNYFSGDVIRNDKSKGKGNSVRCLRD